MEKRICRELGEWGAGDPVMEGEGERRFLKHFTAECAEYAELSGMEKRICRELDELDGEWGSGKPGRRGFGECGEWRVGKVVWARGEEGSLVRLVNARCPLGFSGINQVPEN